MSRGTEQAKVVIIGGGTGVSTVLKQLKHEPLDITAIVTVADNGGSSGKLRAENGQAPPGDIRNVLAALSTLPEEMVELFQYRYKASNKNLGGHVVGNLLIAAMTEMKNSTSDAIEELSKMMKIKGRVLPSAEEALDLNCVFKDGTRVTGEIEMVRYHKEIDYVYVSSGRMGAPVKAGRGVVEAIEEADLIILGPGSLYTSLLPNLTIQEIGDAVKASLAKVLYICNIMTQKGETEGFSDADHVQVLYDHLGADFIDAVLVNNRRVPDTYMQEAGLDPDLHQVSHDYQRLSGMVGQIISNDFLDLRDGGIYHAGDRVSQEITQMAKDHFAIRKSKAKNI